jgi:type III restriction enzyme
LNAITLELLKPFQTRAAASLAKMIQQYPSATFKPRYDQETGGLLPFLCRLRAITGAGKTPILARTASQLENGIVLWTTNRSAIISQTLANLRPGGRYADLLPEGTQVYLLGEMSPSDWSEAMQAENGLTILLATVGSFNQDSDELKIHRPDGDSTRWKMLGGHGLDGRRRKLLVFYDEGHGATERQFMKLRELSPKAFVLASASPLPDDLADLLSGRTDEERIEALAQRTVNVSTKEVVEAGLLKERLYFIDCDTSQSDAVREAHEKWLALLEKLAPMNRTPIACFIVNETVRGVDIWEQLVALGVPMTRIAVHLNGARDVVIERKGTTAGLIDTYTGKKANERSPEALANAGYTHIIWNLSLREGWDEPLAYVAYIDDRGRSATDIVQKIGRFVRQPDATPFDDPDLNSAYFYLNVPDEEFSNLIRKTQEEMQGDGREIIAFSAKTRPPASRVADAKQTMSLPSIRPWFGDDIKALDSILLNAVPMFAEVALQSSGAVRTRVFDMESLDEDESLRSESQREGNDFITPWGFLSARLGSIDSRLVNAEGSVFSADLKNQPKMRQQVQYGSEAIAHLETAVDAIRDKLNEKLQLVSFGLRNSYAIPGFKLVSPDLSGGSDVQRQKYRVRHYQHAIHPEYNALNAFEVRVADALDEMGSAWCRNPVSGYGIPIPELGSDSIWFYPDFLFWNDPVVWALDPKGKHLLEPAITDKLLDLSNVKGLTPTIKVALLLEGQYRRDTEGHWSRKQKDGYTLVYRTRKLITEHETSLKNLLEKLKRVDQ